MRFTLSRKILGIAIAFCSLSFLFAFIYSSDWGENVTIAKKLIPEPFNGFNYLYSAQDTGGGHGVIGASFYRNAEKLVESDGIKWGTVQYMPLSDGAGFYEIKNADKGDVVPCGTELLGKATALTTSNSICITHNSRSYSAVDWPDYADESHVVYQRCEKIKFYTRDDVNLPGENDCQKLLLMVDGREIDFSNEYYNVQESTDRILVGAAKFEAIRVFEKQLTYLKLDALTQNNVFVIYDLVTGERTEYASYSGRPIAAGQLVNDVPAFLVWNKDYSKDFFYSGRKVSDVVAFAFDAGNFYFIKRDPAARGISAGINLLKEDISLGHLEGAFWNSSGEMLAVYPHCDFSSLICLYRGGNFAATSSVFRDGNPVRINSTDLPRDVFWGRPKDIYAFTKDGNNFAVYAHLNTVIGRNLDTNESVVLFELPSTEIIKEIRVFPEE